MKLCCYGKIGSNFKIKRTHQKLGTTDKDAIKKNGRWFMCGRDTDVNENSVSSLHCKALYITALTLPRLLNTMKLRSR